MKTSGQEQLNVMNLAARDMTLEEFEMMAEAAVDSLKWAKLDDLKSTETFITFQNLTDFDYERWNESDVKPGNINRVRTRSSLAEPMIANKGGWLFPQKVYLQNPNYLTRAANHRGELDEFVLRQPLCQSIYTRYKFVSEKLLPKYIHAALRNNASVKIVSLGSGTGYDVMEALKSFGPRVTLVCYEIDPLAIEVGLQMAKDFGVEKQVEFKHESFRHCQEEHADIAIMVGIICSLPDGLAKVFAKHASKCLKPDGVLIVSAASEKIAWGDPLSRFMSEYCASLFLEHRTSARMGALMSEAGYEVVELTEESMEFHRFAVGKPSSNLINGR
jgi:SAM-dependent methyltransferase